MLMCDSAHNKLSIVGILYMLFAGVFMVAIAIATAVGFLWLVKTVEVSPVIPTTAHDNHIDSSHNRHTRQSSNNNRVTNNNANSGGSVRRGLFDDNGRATTSNVIARDDAAHVVTASTQQQLAAVVSVGGAINGTEIDSEVVEISTTSTTVNTAAVPSNSNSNSNANSGGSWYRNFNRQQVCLSSYYLIYRLTYCNFAMCVSNRMS
jgi:hypothetical protein